MISGCARVEGDEDDAADMDDFEDEFQIKSPKKAQDFNSVYIYIYTHTLLNMYIYIYIYVVII